jgi:hypothetical protein
MSKEFLLHSGRQIKLHELRQYLTYEGLLEGLPTAETNQLIVKSFKNYPKNRSYDVSPHLIPPVEKPLNQPHGEKYPFGTPSALPPITCIARFQSRQPTKNGNGDFSGLTVVWFQNDFAFPIDPTIIEQIESIDWDSCAGNNEY